MCLGGSIRMAEALVEDIRDHGGEIRTGIRPRRSDAEGAGDRRGAGLWRAHRARASSLGLNPQQTFLDLLDASSPTADAGSAAGFRYNQIARCSRLNLAARGPP
jgi:phytoene dehydrogenase-like protein